nr:V-type proton ATPase 116 kDa subunit a-like isoform X2 [Halyomorpha halys]
MGDLFRSEHMSLCQLFIQPEAAYACVSLLGEMGIVQFRDLNSDISAYQRKFVSEVRRCEEIERRLRYIGSELKKDGVTVPELHKMPAAPNPRELTDLEEHIERTEGEILEMSQNAVNLKSNFMELTELKHVLEKTDAFFQEQEGDIFNHALIVSGDDRGSRTQLGFVAGVVPRGRVFAFERMLWRISRGNVLLRHADIEELFKDPATGNLLLKTVFVAFYQGEELKARVKKVCMGFHATLYPSPATSQERLDMVQEVKTRIEDLKLILNQTADHRYRVLLTVAKQLPKWTTMVRKMKAVYHTMNCFNMDGIQKCLIGECWVASHDLHLIHQALADGGNAVGSTIPSFLNVIKTNEEPPTYNRTNNFTQGFQNLIDAYGIASYGEVNPALYTIITFPFLFAVMFGDIGHGFILSLFAAWMVICEKKLMKKKSNNEIWNIFFGGRYIILLMGLFSMYTGLVYNDIFSKSVNLFGSSWRQNYDRSTVLDNTMLTLNPSTDDYSTKPYPFGIDPVWQLAYNKINFLNTYKMKISIIIGVIHMIFGVFLSIPNHLHRGDRIYILLEFLPQLVFLLALFFYLVMLMFLKFFLYSGEYDQTNPLRGIHCAPQILIMFINMMLMKSPTLPGADNNSSGDQSNSTFVCDPFMYSGQDAVQKALVGVALLCIPIMLLGKPLYLIYFKNKKLALAASSNGDVGCEMQAMNGAVAGVFEDGAEEEYEEEPASEIFIHQVIHTIEYVLSTVSHTASYLRLWALSLAHSQLSDVLWNRVLTLGFGHGDYFGGITLYIIFAIWAFFTITILVLMEGLSAFLHTLRLHWVEFMSKFYAGLGHPFQPFSFENILEDSEETD